MFSLFHKEVHCGHSGKSDRLTWTRWRCCKCSFLQATPQALLSHSHVRIFFSIKAFRLHLKSQFPPAFKDAMALEHGYLEFWLLTLKYFKDLQIIISVLFVSCFYWVFRPTLLCRKIDISWVKKRRIKTKPRVRTEKEKKCQIRISASNYLVNLHFQIDKGRNGQATRTSSTTRCCKL